MHVRPIFNSVYDPMYEAMGLPIDPHLRMFLASKRDRDSGSTPICLLEIHSYRE